MKYTLLDMTQDILSAMSADEVNSISDNAESLQVATIIKNKYYDIVARGDLPEHNQIFQLNPSLDQTQPTMMHVPDGIGQIDWIKYFDSNPNESQQQDQYGSYHDTNVNIVAQPTTFTSTSTVTLAVGNLVFTVAAGLPISALNSITGTSGVNTLSGTIASYTGTTLTIKVTSFIGSGTYSSWVFTVPATVSTVSGYKYVTMLPIQQFLDMTAQFNVSDSDVRSFTFQDTSNNFPGGFTFYYKNDKTPQYCCILSNYYVIFDSFDSTQDSTLQAEKTMCFGQVVPTFQMTDTFVPDLDAQQFPLLLNEAKALAFYELKQQPHALAAQEIKRQWSTVQKNKSINNRPAYFDELPNFGRTPGKYQGTLRGFTRYEGNTIGY